MYITEGVRLALLIFDIAIKALYQTDISAIRYNDELNKLFFKYSTLYHSQSNTLFNV